MEIVYPNAFEQKVLVQEAPGGSPQHVYLVVPTITMPNQPFVLKVAVVDQHGCPAYLEQPLAISGPTADQTVAERVFEPGQLGIAFVDGVVLSEEGLQRFQVKMGDRTFFSNPTYCTAEPMPQIFWGDPHVHTVTGNCHPDKARSLNYCYLAGRYLSGLDWIAAADHVSNGRCEFAKWKEQRAVCEHYNRENDFVTLPAYEASFVGGAGGDNNVYLNQPLEMYIDEYEGGSVKTLCEKLGEITDGTDMDFFVVPHHTTRSGKHGEIPSALYPGEAMPVLEIHSKWGTSEYRGNTNALISVHPGPSYAIDLLERLPLGFIAGTDTHASMTFGAPSLEPSQLHSPPGITAVFADSLSREAIFAGIKQRQCYAASGERMYLSVTVGGKQPGQILFYGDTAELVVDVTAAGQSDIASIEIVRNGQVVHTQDYAGQWQAALSYRDNAWEKSLLRTSLAGDLAYYYVRVTTVLGHQAWSSPVWVRGE